MGPIQEEYSDKLVADAIIRNNPIHSIVSGVEKSFVFSV